MHGISRWPLWLRWGWLVVLMLVLVGHVCELPAHHAVMNPAHDEDSRGCPSNAPDHSIVGDASCEAASNPSVTPAGTVTAWTPSGGLAPRFIERTAPLVAPPPAVSPPALFLLHASLLI